MSDHLRKVLWTREKLSALKGAHKAGHPGGIIILDLDPEGTIKLDHAYAGYLIKYLEGSR